jgi:hypothetical protein
MSLEQGDPKVDKNNLHFSLQNKRIHKYKWGQRKPKWKAWRASTSNAQAEAVGGGEGARREAERQEKPLEEKMPKRLENAADDETCHAKKKAPHLEHGTSCLASLLLPSSFFL